MPSEKTQRLPILRIGLVADDLTGAADSIAAVVKSGGKAAVVIGADTRFYVESELDGIAISTETRDLNDADPAEIVRRVEEAFHKLHRDFQPSLFYKKIDSTLRGSTAIEIDASCGCFEDRTALICPAFPEQYRTVVNNTLYVAGTDSGSVSARITRSNRDANVASLSISVVRAGADAIQEKLIQMQSRGARKVSFDAESAQDLAAVATVVLRSPDRWLPVGSAGFIRAICGLVAKPSAQQSYKGGRAGVLTQPGQVVVLVGTGHEVSRRQLETLLQRSGLESDHTMSGAFDKLTVGSRLAIASTPADSFDAEDPLRMLMVGAELVAKHLPPPRVVVTGGATAAAFLSAVPGFSHIEIEGEIEPGIVFARVMTLSGTSGIQLVLKSGGFGDVESLLRCALQLDEFSNG